MRVSPGGRLPYRIGNCLRVGERAAMQVTVAGPSAALELPAGDAALARPAAGARALTALACGSSLTLLAFGLRTWLLGGPSLWYDEGVSWSLARLPLPDMLARLAAADFNPPLYLAMLHFWLPMAGESEYALRFMSALAGVLGVPLCWVLARQIFRSRRAAAFAAALAGTSIFLIDFSQEARGYTLAAAFGLLSAYALARLLAAPVEAAFGGWWWTYLLATAAALYTHYAMILLLPAHVALVAWRRERLVAVGAAWLAGATLYVPWLPSLWRQITMMRATPDFWAGNVAWTLAPERVVAAITVAPGALTNHPRVLLLGGGAFLALTTLAAVVGPASRRAIMLLPVLLVGLPLLEVALLTTIFPKFIDRYLLPVAPFAYVAVAGIVALDAPSAVIGARVRNALRQPVRYGLRAVAGLLAMIAAIHALRHAPLGAEEIKDGDTRAAVAFITAHAQPGDAVLLAQDTGPVFSYYYKGTFGGPGVGWFGVAPEFSRGDDLPALAAALNTAAKGHSRLWVLLWHEDFADPTGYLRNALDVGATRVLTYKAATNYDLRLYQLRPDTRFSARATPLQPMSVRFGPHITFLGLGLEQWDVPADTPFVYHTWFRTDAPLDRDYQAVLRLERGGHVWYQAAYRPSLYTYPAQRWLPGIDVPGRIDFQVGADVPPGDYHVTLSLYDPVAQHDLSAVDATRGAIGTEAELGLVRVLPPLHPSTSAPPPHIVGRAVDPGFTLWGSDVLPTHVQQGASLDLTLFWKANGWPSANYLAQLELAPAGEPALPVVVTAFAPPAPGLGSKDWPAGSAFRDIRTLQLPARTPPGPALLQVRVRPVGAGPDVVLPLGQLIVDARPRDMSPPSDIGTPVGAVFGDAALLAGIQLDTSAAQPGGQVVVTLFWQCRNTLDQDYTVFIHFLDAANAIGGRQHDGPPNDGLDPTTSWLPNQWIVDRHVVPLPIGTPPGTYRIEVGLYRQVGEGFQRLPLATGGDALIAGTITVR